MATTLVQNYIHIVFSTKQRAPILKPPYEKELHAYLKQICFSCRSEAKIVGGHLNHIHILCQLSKKITLMELVKKLKANSSRWLKTKNSYLSNFQWQRGYAAFSVNAKGVDMVVEYIRNQKHHHKEKIFKNELIELLQENEVGYEERYLWD